VIVEFLTFPVPRRLRDRWLAVEQRTWSEFLVRQRGFVDKQLWVEPDHEDEIHAVIRWTDEESWKSIPEEELAAVDEAMGSMRRAPELRVFHVVDEIASR
jgi:uncharacterized protein (TIGR03792 family)